MKLRRSLFYDARTAHSMLNVHTLFNVHTYSTFFLFSFVSAIRIENVECVAILMRIGHIGLNHNSSQPATNW